MNSHTFARAPTLALSLPIPRQNCFYCSCAITRPRSLVVTRSQEEQVHVCYRHITDAGKRIYTQKGNQNKQKKNHEKLNNGEIPAFDDGETITNRAICWYNTVSRILECVYSQEVKLFYLYIHWHRIFWPVKVFFFLSKEKKRFYDLTTNSLLQI